jgi:molecular chaperone GrpE
MTTWDPGHASPGPGNRPASGDAFGHQRTAEPAVESPDIGDFVAPETESVSREPAPEAAVSSPPEAVTSDQGAQDSGEPDPIAELMRERDDYKDALIRLQADFENYKKRMIKQQTEHLERAAGYLVEKLLPVLDTADLAVAHGGGEEVKHVTAALGAALEREGLERIDPLGQPFDPTRDEAVAHEPGAGPQEVIEVMRAGYSWKGRMLRPAMVKVRG